MSRVVINLANNVGWYIRGQARLIKSFREVGGYGGEILAWHSEAQIGSPKHKENPYAFKVHAFQKAIDAGYKQIFWADSAVFAIRNMMEVFEIIEKEGYFMQEAGHMVGRWTNDRTLNYFGITRDEAMKMMMYGNAGLLGLNTENETAMEFFRKWKASMEAGMFKGQWQNINNCESTDSRCDGHRHDMSCGSIIAHQLGMNENYKSGNHWLEYAPPEAPAKNDKIIFKTHPA